MTTGFHQLRIGDSVELKGPLGSFIWDGPSTALWKGVRIAVKEVGMICGGSGMSLYVTSTCDAKIIPRRYHTHSTGVA